MAWGFFKKNGQHEIENMERERQQRITNVRLLRDKMNALIRRAVDADDLDKSVLAMEYDTCRRELESELQQIKDLNSLVLNRKNSILRERELQEIKRMQAERAMLTSERDVKDQDELTVYREMQRESFDKMNAELQRRTPDLCPTDTSEFDKLVAEAAKNRAADAEYAKNNQNVFSLFRHAAE